MVPVSLLLAQASPKFHLSHFGPQRISSGLKYWNSSEAVQLPLPSPQAQLTQCPWKREERLVCISSSHTVSEQQISLTWKLQTP